MRIVELRQNGRPPCDPPQLKTWCESLVLVLLSSNANRSTNYPGTLRSQPDAPESMHTLFTRTLKRLIPLSLSAHRSPQGLASPHPTETLVCQPFPTIWQRRRRLYIELTGMCQGRHRTVCFYSPLPVRVQRFLSTLRLRTVAMNGVNQPGL